MPSVADKIIRKVRGKGRGWVFTPKDLLDFGTRASVDMALTRLAQSGDIRRIGRGCGQPAWPLKSSACQIQLRHERHFSHKDGRWSQHRAQAQPRTLTR